MYNSDIPTRAELPSTAQLIKSTFLAFVAAIIILVTIVLPSEYAVDPTGVGKLLNLTEMGEIKQQLKAEAEADLQSSMSEDATGRARSLIDGLFGLLVSPAQAQTAAPEWTDERTLTLVPGQGIEIKLVMEEGAEVEFRWIAEGGVLNYDLHGDGSGKNVSYEKGRGVPGQDGVLRAEFTGNHGWFWRNRDKQDVTLTLSVRGAYSEILQYD
jgi:hypothetical protein